MNGKANAKPEAEVIALSGRLTEEEDDALTWQWMMAQLHDEAHQIRAALDEHAELGNPDWTLGLSMWSNSLLRAVPILRNEQGSRLCLLNARRR
jgi:hypothetical protein